MAFLKKMFYCYLALFLTKDWPNQQGNNKCTLVADTCFPVVCFRSVFTVVQTLKLGSWIIFLTMALKPL